MALPLQVIYSFSLADFNILSWFSVLNVFTIKWYGEVLFWSCLIDVIKAYPYGHLFLKICLVFCCYFVGYVSYVFGLHLFFFFNAHRSWIWSFNGISGSMHIPFIFLHSFWCVFIFFYGTFTFSSSLDVLSSIYYSLLERHSTEFFICLEE
jgi:hypothetical protein